MALYLVGENIDKARSHSLAGTGQLVQMMRGIYADQDGDTDALVLKHAARIAKYLYPHAYLSAASAVLLGPTTDNRLYLSSRRGQRTRIRSLEIIQNVAPRHPSTGPAIIDDGMGEFRVQVSSIRQRFLEAFRVRSEHAMSINQAMREAIGDRLIEEYGSAGAAADAVWKLARENEWTREGELAERFLSRKPQTTEISNGAVLTLTIAWHGQVIGHLTHDGFEWRWNPQDRRLPLLISQTTPGQLPPFIVSLLPEGWLEKILKDADERTLLRSGKRYMSNITIVEPQAEVFELPPDVLETRLEEYTTDGVFIGRYAGPGAGELEKNFEINLARIYARSDTPRLSGVQMKAPMYLAADGVLSASIGTPFTHILKPASTGGFEGLPVVEWMVMNLGGATGLSVPATALVPMPDGMPPALLVERFDIRRGNQDKGLYALEDLCAVLDLQDKYSATIERVARAIRPISTSPEHDLITLLKRALFAWLVADGDMHMKNLAMLKFAEPGDRRFRSVRLAPLYDAVTTRVFPRLEHGRMAFKLNAKDDNLKRTDFSAFAKTAGIRATDADSAIDDVLTRLTESLEGLALPAELECGESTQRVARKVIEICHQRIARFGEG